MTKTNQTRRKFLAALLSLAILIPTAQAAPPVPWKFHWDFKMQLESPTEDPYLFEVRWRKAGTTTWSTTIVVTDDDYSLSLQQGQWEAQLLGLDVFGHLVATGKLVQFNVNTTVKPQTILAATGILKKGPNYIPAPTYYRAFVEYETPVGNWWHYWQTFLQPGVFNADGDNWRYTLDRITSY